MLIARPGTNRSDRRASERNEPIETQNTSRPDRKLKKMKSSRSASSQAVPARKTSKKPAVSAFAEIPAKPQNKVIQDSREEVALRAYFIGERRRSLGIAGDETSDWVQAEQELSQESKE